MSSKSPGSWPPDLFRGDGDNWQMSFGERAALEGLLAYLRPGLALEIGTAEGGSLERIAARSDEVHAIDLVETQTAAPANVQLHVGDSKQVLPELLADLAAAGRNVDFALVDGDHSSDGVRADLRNLLASRAVGRTLILLHDTMNEATRAGVQSIAFEDFPKVRYVELDFLTGYMGRGEPFAGQLWGGFGVVLVDSGQELQIAGSTDGDPRYYDAHSMVTLLGGGFESEREGRTPVEPAYSRGESAEERRIEFLLAALAEARQHVDSMLRSKSWQITAPIRALSQGVRNARATRQRRRGAER